MTSDEHETLAALEAENADLRSEVSRLRGIAAERDALADEVAALQTRMLEKIRFGRDAAARVAELEAKLYRQESPYREALNRRIAPFPVLLNGDFVKDPRTLSRDEVAALMKEGEKIGVELEARFTHMEQPDPNARDRAR